jgi:hypothetical protein
MTICFSSLETNSLDLPAFLGGQSANWYKPLHLIYVQFSRADQKRQTGDESEDRRQKAEGTPSLLLRRTLRERHEPTTERSKGIKHAE